MLPLLGTQMFSYNALLIPKLKAMPPSSIEFNSMYDLARKRSQDAKKERDQGQGRKESRLHVL